jgi:predicted nucleic acid-binding protein
MAIVLDASVALAWCLADEKSDFARRVLLAAREGEDCVVPAIWPLEVVNGVLVALRRARLTDSEAIAFASLLDDVAIRIDALSLGGAFGSVLALAREHELSSYDASYLELAARSRAQLATLDAHLAAAATRAGVPLFA